MHQLKSSAASTRGLGCILLFATFWLGFSLVWTYMAWRGGGAMALFGVPFIAIGVFLMVLALWRKITGVKIAPPVVLVSNPAPALGEKIRVEWELRFRTKTILQEARIELLFRESASYTQGTDSRTDRHEVVNEFSEIPIGEMTARESVHGQADFIIPEDGMHSFQGQNNQLEWLLRVRLNALEWPDLEEEYLLDVKAQKAWGL